VYARAFSKNTLTNSYSLVSSGTVEVRFTEGVYQIYGCIADDNKYACSSGGRNDCSDVPACQGKPCLTIPDSQLCGASAKTYACIAGDGKYACSPGNKSDLSDVSNNACAGKPAIQILKNQCGLMASQELDNQAGADIPNSQPGAQIPPEIKTDLTDTLYNPLPEDNLTDMLLKLLKGFLLITGLWAVTFIVVGGFQMVMAAGNEESYAKAKKTVTWAVLGFAIAVLSFGIIAAVQNFLGVQVEEVKSPGQTQNE
jgi:hypothetical protein